MSGTCGIAIPEPDEPTELEPLGRGGWLALDLRSLALMRVTVALMLLVDLVVRATGTRMMYSDDGVLPRADMVAGFGVATKYYAYSWFGTAGPQQAIMAVHALVTVLLLVGYRTRIATILSWLLLTSLHLRNPLICHGGDHMVRLTLFWCMFLPLGARWSVDSALNSGPRRRNDAYFDVPVVGFLVQISLVYVVAAVHKMLSPMWQTGDGVYFALHVDQHATAMGVWLRQPRFEFVLPLLSWLTIVVELFGPLLLFLPRFTSRARIITVLSFIGLHVMFGLCFYLTVFPFMAVAVWLGLIPGSVWDWIFRKLRTPRRMGLRIYYDGECGFCQRTAWLLRTFLLLPETPVATVQGDETIEAAFRANDSWVVVDHEERMHLHFDGVLAVVRASPIAWPLLPILALPPSRAVGNWVYRFIARHRGGLSKLVFFLRPRRMTVKPSLIRNVIALGLIVFVCILNARSLHESMKRAIPRQLQALGRAIKLDQNWDMFARGTEVDGWYVLRGVKANGSEIDLVTGAAPVSWDKPDRISSMYPSHRWGVAVMQTRDPSTPARRENFARYACENWNRTHSGDDRLVEVELVFMKELTEIGFVHPPERQSLIVWTCE